TVARSDQRKLDATAVAFCQGAVRNSDLRVVHCDRRGPRTDFIAVNDERSDRKSAVQIWGTQTTAKISVEGKLTTQLNAVAAHLFFNLRQKSRGDQNGLQFSSVRGVQVDRQIG